MTPQQKARFFMPAWSRCVKANGWYTREGAAVTGPARCTEQQKVYDIADRLAERNTQHVTRGCNLRDLRHACYIVALGRDKDTDTLNNREIDRIVALFNLLADPLSLKAQNDWNAYQRGEDPGAKVRRRYFIHTRAPDAMLDHLALDLSAGRTRDHESLTDAEEHNLARLLAQRPIYPGSPKSKAQGPKSYRLNPQRKFEPRSKQQASELPF